MTERIFNMEDMGRIARALAEIDGKLQEYETERANLDDPSKLFIDKLFEELKTYDTYWDRARQILEHAYGPDCIRLFEVIMH